MSLIAEFRISSPDLVLAGALRDAPAVTIEIVTEMATSSDRPVLVFWATDADEQFDAGLDRDPTAHEYTLLDEVGERSLYRVELDTTDAQPIFPTYRRLETAPLSATATHRGWRGRVQFLDRETLGEFRAFCADADIEFSLDSLYTSDGADDRSRYGLTDCQRETILAALDAGYFDIPRGTTLGELADSLGVSAQSTSERLRRGLAQLADQTLASHQ